VASRIRKPQPSYTYKVNKKNMNKDIRIKVQTIDAKNIVSKIEIFFIAYGQYSSVYETSHRGLAEYEVRIWDPLQFISNQHSANIASQYSC
jgi:hypothetical protein